ncbi:MAG: serine/threonine protein phosphatase [Gemmatimonadetes bacterium]|nr:serine/threonine protein phosphatase [Gemmatimonadota bacterium]
MHAEPTALTPDMTVESVAVDEWRHAEASIAGLAHEKSGTPCQDAHSVQFLPSRSGTILIVAVADGAGSAKHSAQGSRIACDAAVEVVRRHIEREGDIANVQEESLHLWFDSCAERVADRAAVLECENRDLACTLLLAVISPQRAVFAQLGDGAIVIERNHSLDAVSWPQNGEFINTTLFITSPSDRAELQTHILEEAIGEIAMFTDGLEFLALEFAERRAHTPFFAPLLASTRMLLPVDTDSANAALGDFLASPPVRERTDDDLTLVLASRRPPHFALSPTQVQVVVEPSSPEPSDTSGTTGGDEP